MTNRQTTFASICSVIAFALLPAFNQASAQTSPDSILAVFTKSARAYGGVDQGLNALVQRSGKLSTRQRDMLADSLVSIVLDADGKNSPTRAKHDAIMALGLSGSRSQTAVRYDGATSRLLRIFSSSSNEADLWDACYAESLLPDNVTVVAAMSQMAKTRPALTRLFISCLAVHMQDLGGTEALRVLYETDALSDSLARAQLEQAALKLGWKRKP